jgi:hypothetical protein
MPSEKVDAATQRDGAWGGVKVLPRVVPDHSTSPKGPVAFVERATESGAEIVGFGEGGEEQLFWRDPQCLVIHHGEFVFR